VGVNVQNTVKGSAGSKKLEYIATCNCASAEISRSRTPQPYLGVVVGAGVAVGVPEVDGVVEPGVDGVVAPGDVVIGPLAPFDGGIVVAPGPVPGAHGAIMSAFGAPFDPSVLADPVVPTAPVTPAEVDPVAALVFAAASVVADGVAGNVPAVVGGTLPVAPAVGPASGTHGTLAAVDGVLVDGRLVDGAVVGGPAAPGVAGAPGVTTVGVCAVGVPVFGVGVVGVAVVGVDVVGVAACGVDDEGLCAASGIAQSPSVSAAAEAMSVGVFSMAPPYSYGGCCTGRARSIVTIRCNGRARLRRSPR